MSPVGQNSALPTGKKLRPFGYVALGWLVIGLALSYWIESRYGTGAPGRMGLALGSVVGFWGLCALDLWTLTRFLAAVFQWLDSTGEKRGLFLLQTAFWGSLKLICLGLFFLTLLKGQKIPMHGLLLGMGTLVVVPVVGGFIWRQRILKNA